MPAPQELALLAGMDTLAEWSKALAAKPLGSPRVGSNPTGVVFTRLCCLLRSGLQIA